MGCFPIAKNNGKEEVDLQKMRVCSNTLIRNASLRKKEVGHLPISLIIFHLIPILSGKDTEPLNVRTTTL